MRLFRAIALVSLVITRSVPASDLPVTISVEHKLTRKRVTLSANAYERGVAVPIREAPVRDVLAYERSHVVVYLEDELSATPRTEVIRQENRQFVPNLVVVPAGSTVSFPNFDTIFHNVFSLSHPKAFDLGNYPKGQTRTVTFATLGLVLVNCRLHANMAAAILVTPNDFAAVSDADGRVLLRNVPPGPHTVVAWHKAAGYFRKSLTVQEGSTAAVGFFIPLDEAGNPRAIASR